MSFQSKRLQGWYEFFLEQRGKPTFSQKVDSQVILNWENKLPSSLLRIWQELGWCSFHNGLLWIVNPDDYQYLVDTWLDNTKYLQLDNFYCIARTAFGECLLYGERTKRIIQIQPQYNTIWADDKQLQEPDDDFGASISTLLYLKSDIADFDITDIQDEPLFERAVKKLGVLSPDEMYAFEPFYMLLPDEQIIIERLIKVRMDVYTDMLYQFQPPVSRGTSFSDIFK
ncbi:GAD-like domain [Moraxella caprae]|uniref:GAD-like domain n=1 Tax=Moraxella caprae TaxID=90240 RepID=A0A378QXQ2_9GAMM|nr:GAD-like domain-containing protein [Moraxella caprae]STZ07695.1 GAD-like domain [Moraxella caprae]